MVYVLDSTKAQQTQKTTRLAGGKIVQSTGMDVTVKGCVCADPKSVVCWFPFKPR